MNPDSAVLIILVEKQQTIEQLRAENAQLRQRLEQAEVDVTD